MMIPNYRHSRREVTKRKFMIGPLLDKQPPSKSSNVLSTKVSPIAAFALASPFKEPQSHSPRQTSDRELAESIRSSPLAAIIEQQHDDVTPSPRNDRTQQDETQFLSSTPKPGKAVSSRRRPVFYKDKPYSRPSSSAKPDKLNLSNIPKVTRAKEKPVTVETPVAPHKPSSSAKPNKLNLSNKQKVTRAHEKPGIVETPVAPHRPKVTRATEKHASVEKRVAPHRPCSGTKVTKGKQSPQVSQTSNKRSKVSEATTQVRAKSRFNVSKTRLDTNKDSSIIVQSQSTKPSNDFGKRRRVLSSTRTDDSVSKRSREAQVLQKRRAQPPPAEESEVEEEEEDENVVPRDVLMPLWQKQGTKRKKSDFCAVDVVLNTVTELLETQLDECDSQVERKAVQIMEKYLVEDITAMIDNCQSLKKLQTDARKTRQVLAEKQRTLMELQKKRLRAEEIASKDEETSKSSENRQKINKFLGHLKHLIAKC